MSLNFVQQLEDDGADLGSDASIDAFATITGMFWMNNSQGDAGITDALMAKGQAAAVGGNGWGFYRFTTAVANVNGALRLTFNRAVTDGTWDTPNNSLGGTGVLEHVAFSYVPGDTADDPELYINGVLQAEVETSVPAGAVASDAGESLRFANDGGADNGFDGTLGWFVYDDVAPTAADVNRHRWWGMSPGGPSTMSVWHPAWENNGNSPNKGTATANLSGLNQGFDVNNTNIPRVMRPGCGGF